MKKLLFLLLFPVLLYGQTKNIVPRATDEGQIGTTAKHWRSAWIDSLISTGSVSGGIAIVPIATGTAITTIRNQNVATAIITLPSATTTLPGLSLSNTWTGTNTLPIANLGIGITSELHPLSVGGTLASAANRFTVDTLGNPTGAIGTFQIVNLGVGITGELHPLSVGGTLASAANRATIDTLGNLGAVAGTFTSTVTTTYSKTAAADVGTVRAIYGKYALTGSTPVTTASNNMIGGRGEFNIGTGVVLDFYAGSSFGSGIQGKVVASGTSTIGSTTGHQDARVQAVHGQLDLTGVTINGGQVSIAEFDVQVRPTAINGVNQFNLLKITDASSDKTTEASCIFYAYAHAHLFMDLVTPEGAAADWVSTGGSGYTYTLKVNFNGATKYLRLYDSQ